MEPPELALDMLRGGDGALGRLGVLASLDGVDDVPRDAQTIAVAAAAATGASLVGVDLLPVRKGWTVLEVNGAVEFTDEYSLDGDVFAEAGRALVRAALGADLGAAELAAA